MYRHISLTYLNIQDDLRQDGTTLLLLAKQLLKLIVLTGLHFIFLN